MKAGCDDTLKGAQRVAAQSYHTLSGIPAVVAS
jgi:hypothetical protein